MNKKYWWAGAFVLAVGLVTAWWWMQSQGSDAAKYRTAALTQGPLQATVAASGTVSPVAQVSVGTQVSGQIRDVLVDFNSEVQAGQLLARIDPQSFEYRVASTRADLQAARATVLSAQAGLASAQAQQARSRSDLDEAVRDHERKQSLVERAFIAPAEADKARALVSTTEQALMAAQAQVDAARAQIAIAQASVTQRESALAQAQVDLERTRITSPVQGIVIKRSIERGQTVASSLQAPELFVIAQNLSDMQVEAAIDESDVGRLRAGQQASFTVDAFPGQTYQGTVRQLRKAAQNISNVVTYVAVIGFSNEDGRLLPGMTANVRVVTDQRDAALQVPNAALRMRIAGVEPEAAAVGAHAKPEKGARTSRAPGRSAQGRVYVLDVKGKPKAYSVRTGISDGSSTELVLAPDSPAHAALKEGVEVLVGLQSPAPASPPKAGGPAMRF